MTKSVHGKNELHPDAWERFERAVDTVAKAPPQHRKAVASKKKAKPHGGATKKRKR
jgi:hypothetical protein